MFLCVRQYQLGRKWKHFVKTRNILKEAPIYFSNTFISFLGLAYFTPKCSSLLHIKVKVKDKHQGQYTAKLFLIHKFYFQNLYVSLIKKFEVMRV